MTLGSRTQEQLPWQGSGSGYCPSEIGGLNAWGNGLVSTHGNGRSRDKKVTLRGQKATINLAVSLGISEKCIMVPG